MSEIFEEAPVDYNDGKFGKEGKDGKDKKPVMTPEERAEEAARKKESFRVISGYAKREKCLFFSGMALLLTG